MAASRDWGFGTGVAEPLGIGLLPFLDGLAVEVAHHRRPVVLRDESRDLGRQVVLLGQLHAVANVGGDDPGAGLGAQLVVDVRPTGLVLDEGQRVLHLADVVVVGRHAGEQRVGTDRLRRPLGEVADHDRVVVGPRRLEEQAAQQPVGRVGELQHLEDGEDPEHVAQHGEAADRQDHGQGRVDEASQRQLGDAGRIQPFQQAEGNDHRDVDQGQHQAGADEGVQALGLENDDEGRESAGGGVHHRPQVR